MTKDWSAKAWRSNQGTPPTTALKPPQDGQSPPCVAFHARAYNALSGSLWCGANLDGFVARSKDERKEKEKKGKSFQSQVSTWYFQLGAGPCGKSFVRYSVHGQQCLLNSSSICRQTPGVKCQSVCLVPLSSAIFCYLPSSAICRLLLSVLAALLLLHNQKRGVVLKQNAIFWMIHVNNLHFSGPTPCSSQTGGCYLYPLKHMLHILLSPVLEFRVRSRTLFGCQSLRTVTSCHLVYQYV